METNIDDKLAMILSDLKNELFCAHRGYKNIESEIDDENLKQIFKFYIEQKQEFINALENELDKLETPVHPKVASKFNQWNEIEKLTDHNIKSLLDFCEKCENETIKKYEANLNLDFPAHYKTILSQQLGGIKEAHYHMKLLRDSR